MSRQAWLAETASLIARTSKVDPAKAGNHPAYKAALAKIDSLIEFGLQHEYIEIGEAARL